MGFYKYCQTCGEPRSYLDRERNRFVCPDGCDDDPVAVDEEMDRVESTYAAYFGLDTYDCND